MKQVKDLNKKRVCDISDDRKTVFIRRGDCVTEVRAEKTVRSRSKAGKIHKYHNSIIQHF